MKKFVAVIFSCIFLFAIAVTDGFAGELSTSAQASVLICADNGKVLYSHNMNTRLKMASTTKLMTALLTLESAKKDNRVVTFKENMIEKGSSMYLKVGEKLRLEDLCVGMLLPSGNDASTCSAVSLAGSKENFAKLMNSRAEKIGMKNTNFVTPSGLDDPHHYSTAYDMALLMKECLKNKKFCEISGSVSRTVSFVSPKDKTVTYQNHNRLLSSYEYCISGKTGYTESAGRCLVTASRKNGVTLIAVTLNDRNDWEDHTSLYEYGFSKVHSQAFSKKTITQSVVGGAKDFVKLNIEGKSFITNSKKDKITLKILVDPFAYAPINKGDRAGLVLYCKNGRVIDKSTIYYDENIEYKTTQSGFWEFIKGLF